MKYIEDYSIKKTNTKFSFLYFENICHKFIHLTNTTFKRLTSIVLFMILLIDQDHLYKR